MMPETRGRYGLWSDPCPGGTGFLTGPTSRHEAQLPSGEAGSSLHFTTAVCFIKTGRAATLAERGEVTTRLAADGRFQKGNV